MKSYDNGLTYVNKQELADWLQRTSTYQKQTEFVDMYTYLVLADKDKASSIIRQYKDAFERHEGFYRKGTIPQKVFNMIRRQYNLYSDISKNLDVTQRRKYMWKDADHLDVFKEEIYFPSDFKNEETCYRTAFLNGDIKMTIGKGKTIFIKTKQDISGMKMPFLVQADARMLIK